MTEPSQLAVHLDYLLKQYDRLIQAHDLVVMDTPEDRELHGRVVAEFRKAAEPVRKLLTEPQGVTARQFGCCDIADDPNERGAVERTRTEEDAREDAASWATGRAVYRDVTYGPWRFFN